MTRNPDNSVRAKVSYPTKVTFSRAIPGGDNEPTELRKVSWENLKKKKHHFYQNIMKMKNNLNKLRLRLSMRAII